MWLLNTSYMTFDGIGTTGATTLNIHSIYNDAFGWNDGIDFNNNSDHNVIQNIVFINEDEPRGGGGSSFWAEGSSAPDSNLIQNNFVKQAGLPLFISCINSSARGKGNIIRGNQIGSETDSLIAWGIQVEQCQNTIVENNIVQNIRCTHILGEIISTGINSYSGSGDIIRNNIVHNIKSGYGYLSTGILLSGGLGSNNSIYNNMVYDIQSTSPRIDSRLAGIQIWLQSDPKIYYNSVYLSGNGTNHLGSAAFYIYGGFGNSINVEAKNNIFVNTRDESPYCASSIYDYSAANLTTDYNDLYFEPSQDNCLVRIGSNNYQTLADWQATGKDINSITEMPGFKNPYLHIDESIPTFLESGATPIAGIDSDIDGDTRDASTPDIGADEFGGVQPVGIEEETLLPIKFLLAQNFPNPFNPTTTIGFSIQNKSSVKITILNVIGEEVAVLLNEEKESGYYKIEFNAANLPNGVYFYRLQAGDFVQTRKMILLK